MIYFDNAATTFPKPPAVIAETARCMREYCGNPGRGAHRMALRAAEAVYRCREAAAELFSAPGAENVAFTLNTTYALNMAIKSVVRPGDHVLISNMEHNAVMRPLYKLAREDGVRFDTFDLRRTPREILSEMSAKVCESTRAVVCVHASNICGITAPVAEIGAFCRARGMCFLLDGAQSAGILPIDMEAMQIDILCVPGHKGLYGPQGCGMMIFGNAEWRAGATLVEGGSGSNSLTRTMPEETPERFEAGTLPTPQIVGLGEGIRFVQRIGTDAIHARECELWRRAADDMRNMRGVRLYDETPGAALLFSADGMTPEELASALDRAGICVRAGFHCAPAAHRTLGTGERGAVRLSFGVMNTESEVRRFCGTLYRILAQKE